MITPLQIRYHLQKYQGWEHTSQNKIEKVFIFQDFIKAMIFLNKIINPIEEQHSYPTIQINYNRVFISLYNHHVSAITERELALIDAFEKLV